ncbi:hypothetical protein GGF32_007982 [Allomyces javanicus]|nr:hypothetical protein GGF32_007982 [Allomyces javanicus]
MERPRKPGNFEEVAEVHETEMGVCKKKTLKTRKGHEMRQKMVGELLAAMAYNGMIKSQMVELEIIKTLSTASSNDMLLATPLMLMCDQFKLVVLSEFDSLDSMCNFGFMGLYGFKELARAASTSHQLVKLLDLLDKCSDTILVDYRLSTSYAPTMNRTTDPVVTQVPLACDGGRSATTTAHTHDYDRFDDAECLFHAGTNDVTATATVSAIERIAALEAVLQIVQVEAKVYVEPPLVWIMAKSWWVAVKSYWAQAKPCWAKVNSSWAKVTPYWPILGTLF